MGQPWVSKYNPEPDAYHTDERLSHRDNVFYDYNVWGFKDESWRKLIIEADPNQPWPKGYHGATLAFVIHQLIRMFQPKGMSRP